MQAYVINNALAKYVNIDKSGIGEPTCLGVAPKGAKTEGERNFKPTEWAKDERQGSARFSGRSPCNNKKLNGARGTGDRTKAMR